MMLRIFFLLIFILPAAVGAQKSGKVEVAHEIFSEELKSTCSNLVLGKLLFYYEPEFPVNHLSKTTVETVEVIVKVGESGSIAEVVSVAGIETFRDLAERSSKKAKFSQTICDGKPIGVSAKFSYVFHPTESNSSYFFPVSVEDFTDLEESSPYYTSVSSLTDSYEICFGYSGGKFSAKSPLTRGDLAQFLRMTLDFLFTRAKESKKIRSEIGLIKSLNPNKLKSIDLITDIDKSMPFYKSVGVLLQTYNIALFSDEFKFQGDQLLTQNELIDLWSAIFGNETVPVNFPRTVDPSTKLSRGEFAIFLNESMQVLSYKVLP